MPNRKKAIKYLALNDVLQVDDDASLGLQIREFPEKGRGVVTLRMFSKGENIVEYAGKLISRAEGKGLETEYEAQEKGCYMFYFVFNSKHYCIDATEEDGRYGRLVNHSCKSPNCGAKVIVQGGVPHLVLFAKKDILPETELLYDYGERDKKVVMANPWLST